MYDEHLGLFSSAATAVLTENEAADLWGAMSFLTACAQLAGVPHHEWWQLHYVPEAVFAWRVVDIAAPDCPDPTNNTVLVLRTGNWQHATGRESTNHRCSALTDLRIDLEGRGCALRGMWEIRERGYSSDLMAAHRRPHRATPRTT